MLLYKIKIQSEVGICPIKISLKIDFSFSESLLVRVAEELDSTVFKKHLSSFL